MPTQRRHVLRRRVPSGSETRGRAGSVLTAITALAAVAASGVAVYGRGVDDTATRLARQQLAVMADGQAADRQDRAVALLTSPDLTSRISAVHALREVGTTAPGRRQAALDVLVGYLRGRPATPGRRLTWSSRPEEAAPDVQVALSAVLDLRGRDATGTPAFLDLSGAALAGVRLVGADLRAVDLSEADLTEADLHGARLTASRLVRVRATRADLRGTDLRDTALTGSDLTGARLEEVSGSGARLAGTSLREANLSGSDLSGASLFEADLTDALVQYADLRWVSFRLTTLTRTALAGTDLRGADLRGAVIDSSLQLARLSGADLRGADLRGSGVEADALDCAWVDGATRLPPGTTAPTRTC
jgi:uncharacterized protein YjbI with pentapeptide repeats